MAKVAEKSVWHKLLDGKYSRRTVLQSVIAAGVASGLKVADAQEGLDTGGAQVANNGAPVASSGGAVRTRPPFTPIDMTFADTLTLPEGYSYQLLAPWGEVLNEAGDEIGFNHDFVGFFPIDLLEGGSSSDEGFLTINHEYPNALFVGGNTEDRTAPAQVEAEMKSVGASVVRVRKEGGRWNVVMDPRNRRITAMTECELTGPARGTEPMSGATVVNGSVGNCSGGQTPWGTLLTCEENVDGYQETWGAAGYNALHQGWVTEIDPFDEGAMPKKRTAMGRFRHENTSLVIAPDGRVVVYMGDDMRDACVYKFVSRGTYNPNDRAANMDLLAEGDLYVADFGAGTWLLLDYERNEDLRNAVDEETGEPIVRNQAEVLADATAAALALGATPTDRPEDIEIHPKTGEVYIAFTNNSNHGNYFGQIVKLREANDDWTSEAFRWEIFAAGGRQSGFSSPDNLVFDPHGNLWMVTDSGTGEGTIYEFLGNNSMFFFPTEGPDVGKAFRFAVGPIEAEMTGPVWTPDGKTLFLAVQHPGEDSESLENPTSTFAARQGTNIPRPTLVAISGFPGWSADA
jgi:uncharacterized protein